MGGARLFLDCKAQCSKRIPKDKFLYQKSTKFNEPFGRQAQMLILGLKGANLDQKGPKMGGAKFFQDCKHHFYKRRPQDKFL